MIFYKARSTDTYGVEPPGQNRTGNHNTEVSFTIQPFKPTTLMARTASTRALLLVFCVSAWGGAGGRESVSGAFQ